MSERCPADFTAYCPAGHLCSDSGVVGGRRRSKVGSRGVQALGFIARRGRTCPRVRPRGGVRRVRPLGEPASPTSSEDELTTTTTTPLRQFASAEELAALRGCVQRGRALFSPPPPSPDQHSGGNWDSAHVGQNSARHREEFDLETVPDRPRPPSWDRASSTQDHAHSRQGSMDYDHLADPCSVSVQFEPSGYECQLVGGSELSPSLPRQRSSRGNSPRPPSHLLPSVSSPEGLNVRPAHVGGERERSDRKEGFRPLHPLHSVGINCSSWPKGLALPCHSPFHLSPALRHSSPPPAPLSSPLLRRHLQLPPLLRPRGDAGSAHSSSLSLCSEHQRTAAGTKGVDGATFKEQMDVRKIVFFSAVHTSPQ